MNGFQMLKESYETLVKQGKVAKEDVESELKVYGFLATCSKIDMCTIADSSAMNDIFRAYTRLACKEAGLNKKQQESVLSALYMLLETVTASEALEK